MLKKLFILTITIIFLAILAFWSPWQNWNLSWINLLGIESKEEFAGLKVISLAGDIDVYIDDEYQGTALDGNYLEVTPINPGEHFITLQRPSDTAQYTEIVRKVNFEPGIDVVIGYEIGPTEEFSEGHILGVRKSFISETGPFLEVFSTPENISVTIDGKYIGETPIKSLSIDANSKHTLKFEKDGYDSLEIEILPDEQEARDLLRDYILTLEINLFARPVNIISE